MASYGIFNFYYKHMGTRKKPKPPDAGKTVRRVARNVIGIVKPSQPIEPKDKRKKPKYKPDPLQQTEEH